MNGLTDNTYIAVNHVFRAVRVFKNDIVPVKFHLKFFCNPNMQRDISFAEATARGGAAYQLVVFWLNNIVDQIVIANPQNDLGFFIYQISESKTMFTPGEPDDNVLARVLHSKIRAVSKGNLEVGGLILQSDDTYNTERYWEGTDYLLPGIEYAGKDVVHAVPWWERSSIDTAEFFVEDHNEDEIQEILTFEDPLADFEKAIFSELSADNEMDEADFGEAEIIDDIWRK